MQCWRAGLVCLDPATTEIYTLSLHDALPISWQEPVADSAVTLAGFRSYAGEAMVIGERTTLAVIDAPASGRMRSEEHTSKLQSQFQLVCRLLFEKKYHERRDTPPSPHPAMSR